MNRRLIEFKDAIASHIIVSFSDDKKFFPSIRDDDGCVGILRMEVFDWDGKVLRSLFCDGEPVPENKIFNEGHAREILRFVNQYVDKIEFIISQCDAGICRSSACAAALSYILNGTDKIFFKPPYYPNRLIYRSILNEFIDNMDSYQSIKKEWDKRF